MVATQAAGDPAPQDDRNTKLVDEITRSDIGVSTLLTRLKQSVSSAQDCAAFFKKRATQEEKNAQEIRKLCRSTLESLRRPDSRQGSYAQQFEELTRIHDRLAENGLQYAAALHQMYDDLTKLTGSMDHGRKQWKLFGLSSEKKVHDADVLVDKAKARLDALADGSAGGRPGRLGFMAAAKSGLSRRDDDMTPMEAATEDYQHKQQNARALRQELMQTQRPQAVNALKDMISECDAGLAALLQKYAQLTEKLMLGNGLCVSPIAQGSTPAGHSLRDVVGAIDNKQDFQSFMLSYASKMPPPPPPEQQPPPPQQQQQQQPQSSGAQQFGRASNGQGPPQLPPIHGTAPNNQRGPNQAPHGIPPQGVHAPGNSHSGSFFAGGDRQRSFSDSPHPNLHHSQGHAAFGAGSHGYHPGHARQASQPFSTVSSLSSRVAGGNRHTPPGSTSSPPIEVTPQQYQPPPPPPPPQQQQQQSPVPTPAEPQLQAHGGFGAVIQQPAILPSGPPREIPRQQPPPNTEPERPGQKPVFGKSLDFLFDRDKSPVPILVYQCIQAVELYGLEVEGIYRVSGEKRHVERLKATFDDDATKLDFRRPEDFFHDVNSVASIMKQFFRELPEPLVTNDMYSEFINAAKIDDENMRRDTLHGLINQLPDSNYATFRVLMLHLYRVQEHSNMNRMNTANLSICFGPTLFGDSSNNMQDAGWAVRAIDTILTNCYAIFEA